MEITIPKIMPSGKQKIDKWYTDILHNSRAAVNKLKKAYLRKPSERNLAKYNNKSQEYKNLCTYSRETDFKDFLETMPDIQTLSNFHKAISGQKPPQINTLKMKDGTFSIPGEDTAKTLTKVHFPHQVPLMKTNYSDKIMSEEEIRGTQID